MTLKYFLYPADEADPTYPVKIMVTRHRNFFNFFSLPLCLCVLTPLIFSHYLTDLTGSVVKKIERYFVARQQRLSVHGRDVVWSLIHKH
jgi:hypothetical protein